jgi:DNA-binding response OmpR family regulator
MTTREPASLTRKRVLITDDEPNVRTAVARSLTLSGYQADQAASGEVALQALEQGCYDAMVLDLRMPGIDGVETMQRAQELCPDLVVIILTGHATLESAIAAVRHGAADYLLKPASVHDIAAVVEQALRQQAAAMQRGTIQTINKVLATLDGTEVEPVSGDDLPRAAGVVLDLTTNSVLFEAEPDRSATLTESEAAILEYLMKRSGQVISCSELANATLGYQNLGPVESGEIVRPHISRLRHKIEADPHHPQLIRNVRGKGYHFSP